MTWECQAEGGASRAAVRVLAAPAPCGRDGALEGRPDAEEGARVSALRRPEMCASGARSDSLFAPRHRRRGSRDHARPAVVAHVVPPPLHHDGNAVPEVYEEEDVDEEPRQPRDEPGQADPAR